VLAELGVVDMPYEINYILGLLNYIEYDTSSLDIMAMYDYLLTIDYENFILD